MNVSDHKILSISEPVADPERMVWELIEIKMIRTVDLEKEVNLQVKRQLSSFDTDRYAQLKEFRFDFNSDSHLFEGCYLADVYYGDEFITLMVHANNVTKV